MTTLKEWLRGSSVETFAASVGIPSRTMYRYVNHERVPPRSTMAKIVAATEGAVTANSWYDVPPQADRAA